MFGIGEAISIGSSLLGGLMGGDDAEDAANAQARASAEAERQKMEFFKEQAGKYTEAGTKYAEDLLGLAGRSRDMFKFDPVTAKTAYGQSRYDPTTGQISTELSDEYAGMRGAFSDMFGERAKAFKGMDPNAYAQDYMQRQQSLLAPGRANDMNKLLQRFQAFGLGGITTNTNIAGGGVAGINPHTAAMTSGWAEQDARLAANAYEMGQGMYDREYGRLKGLFGDIYGIDRSADEAGRMALNWQAQANPFQMAGARGEFDLTGRSYEVPYTTQGDIFRGSAQMLGGIGAGALAKGQAEATGHMRDANMWGQLGEGAKLFGDWDWGTGGGWSGGGVDVNRSWANDLNY